MRAIVLPRHGGPEVLELQEIDRPEPADHEGLVRVIASGTNPVDAELRQSAAWAFLIEQGKLRPLVGQVLPLAKARRAHERLDSGHGTGKVVLRVAE